MAVEQALLALVGAADTGAYQINQSLRFNWADSTRLYRTFGSNNSNANFTVSFWCKRAALAEYNAFLAAQVNASNYEHWMFYNDNAIGTSNGAGGVATDHKSTALFRDPSAWYHVVWKNVASGSTTVYVNNVQMLSFTRGTKAVNGNYNHNIGVGSDSGSFGANFYLAEYHLVDGSALEPSSFAETDTITGAWIPKKYSGSYGTNGFYLKFDPSATNGIGHDHSGNGNNFTATGFVTSGTGTDVMSDTPTNNWCTLNPLNQDSAFTLSNGNLQLTSTATTGNVGVTSTSAVSSGKWYWEATRDSWNINCGTGLITTDSLRSSAVTGSSGKGVTYLGTNIYKNGSSVQSGLSQTVDGDVIGIALDLDSNTVQFYKNNSAVGTAVSISAETWTPSFGMDTSGYAANVTTTFNFGQRAFAYTPPTGFKALNTANLPEPTIKKGSRYMDVKLYTGNGTSQTVGGLGFSPDLVWIKNRSSSTYYHTLVDAVRGATKDLYSNTTDAEGTYSNSLNAFNSDGFTVGSGAWVNGSSNSMVAWAWDANGAGSSNTAGTITSTVSANATAGFSIATYTGNGTAGATVGHGLGVAPKMIMVKRRDTGADWAVYHASTGATKYLTLNNTNSAGTSSAYWNNTEPTSTVFSLGLSSEANTNAATFVAYCFSEVAGYSKFGSYTGNNSSDGSFIYTGFAPSFVMIKALESANWVIFDTSRSPYNLADDQLSPNTSGAEVTNDGTVDLLSNGFKLRNGAATTNAYTYVYAAFASTPFKYSTAR